ncbi:MAG: GNAT family N-acetyltransferase [Chloroflexota bacterium]
MVITARSNNSAPKGARPINMNKDLPQVVRLLEQVFGESVRDGQQIFNPGGLADSAAFLWRFNINMSRLSPGFVWEENGRIVGNVTLLPSQPAGRYLVANVAVHRDHRRQGIARLLMDEAVHEVKSREGQAIFLQVDKENKPAVTLYQQMGFQSLGHMAHWQNSPSRLRSLRGQNGSIPGGPPIRPLPGHRWQEAYDLDQRCLPATLHWPEGLAPDAYKRSWWQRLGDFVNGRHAETWATLDGQNRLNGLASIYGEWGRAHQLVMRVHPAWQGHLERPLLAKLIRRLDYLPQRRIQIHHPDNDETMNQLLREANFTVKRTLTHMRLFV